MTSALALGLASMLAAPRPSRHGACQAWQPQRTPEEAEAHRKLVEARKVERQRKKQARKAARR